MRVLTGLLLISTAVPSTGLLAQASRQYDLYQYGVRTAELSLGGTAAAPTWSIRKKDIAANTWCASSQCDRRGTRLRYRVPAPRRTPRIPRAPGRSRPRRLEIPRAGRMAQQEHHL